jgi:ATP-dependent DNA helicase RecQ
MYKTLKKVFGFDEFRPFQKEAIESIVSKNDTLCIFPTGAGKSLCYQLPALLSKNKVAIVISPLIALIDDQVQKLQKLNIKADKITSSQKSEDIKLTYKRLYNQELSLLYVSPERLSLSGFQDFLLHIDISFFVIDEAHCVSEWGHEFRPDYRKLGFIKKNFNIPICAFTATANSKVQQDIIKSLGLKKTKILKDSFFKNNLDISCLKRVGNGRGQILSFLKKFKNQKGIIYSFTRNQTEILCEFLVENGYKALAYHAGLDNNIRFHTQDSFINGSVQIIVATIAFGMGIDKSDVRFIIHTDLPKSIESYYQEIGRAGRDGNLSHTLLLYEYQDIMKKSQLLESIDNIDYRQNAQNRLNIMYEFATIKSCRHKFLVNYFGEKIRECKTICDNCKSSNVIDKIKDYDYNLEHFDRLRDLRKKIANDKNIKVINIFSDKILKDISLKLPTTKDELLAISGIGIKKYEHYGKVFIDFIKDISNCDNELLKSINKTNSILESSKKLGIDEVEIIIQLQEFLKNRNISKEKYDFLIEEYLENIPDNFQKWYMQGLLLVNTKEEFEKYINILNII